MAGDMNATPLLLSNQIRVVANVIACITLPFGFSKDESLKLADLQGQGIDFFSLEIRRRYYPSICMLFKRI